MIIVIIKGFSLLTFIVLLVLASIAEGDPPFRPDYYRDDDDDDWYY